MKILVVDDETAILNALEILFRGEGYEVMVADSGPKALAALEDERPDVVLTDIRMPGADGLAVLTAARQIDPEMAVILMTAQASLQTAVRAVNEGAYYYLQKPFANDELLAICRRAAESRQLKVENRRLKKEIRSRQRASDDRPIGTAARFIEVLELAETVAATESTVLISGESGTGKEVVARYIHELSDRADGPFLSINCGALPESLLESEMFGHVKGSFTGAVKDKDGLLVAGAGGTFFLDEIGEMSPATQVKVLRAIQEREVIPVGATKAVAVDVRIIAATNRDLEEEIVRGAFRSDLYYRLNVIQLHLPPLRERREDISILAKHFLARRAAGNGAPMTITEEALEVLRVYDWPGNVRELENAIERAVVMTNERWIRPEHLSPVLGAKSQEDGGALIPGSTLAEIERVAILKTLEAVGGSTSRAAAMLGISPRKIQYRMRDYREQGHLGGGGGGLVTKML
jgi:two-component system response regulator HydG